MASRFTRRGKRRKRPDYEPGRLPTSSSQLDLTQEDLELIKQQKELGLQRRQELYRQALAKQKCTGCAKRRLKRSLGLK